MTSKEFYTKVVANLLSALRPDIVHFQHTLHLGYDLIRQTRNTLPEAAIVYTLHEFLPICQNHGQMMRTIDDSLCEEASPRRCHGNTSRKSPSFGSGFTPGVMPAE
jgi:hypothetical protein